MQRLVLLAVLSSVLAGAFGFASAQDTPPFVIGAIPDQDPEKLQRLYGTLADYLSEQLGVPVEYRPVQDYAASVTAFRVGDLQMVWFGGLTGVQARLQVEDARAILQRDIDAEFTSVFIANTAAGIEPFEEIDGLEQLRGLAFTFGSESSTSGRLMPQYFLGEAGVTLADFDGEVGFSGSHDATIQLVEAGAFDAGALNAQVWAARVEAGEVDTEAVEVIWTTPPYFDYHWVIRPEVTETYGEDFVDKVIEAFTNLDPADETQAEILELFGAESFIPTEDENYAQIEAVAREVGLIVTEEEEGLEPTEEAAATAES
jgi:phosphonate transport system substrate-binding protein